MESLESIRAAIVSKRKAFALRQQDLARLSHVSLPTIKALEQGRVAELGFNKVVRILAALGLELHLREANHGRPTLDDLTNEAGDD
jgi:transcriptional regulator with XRE-family HTH domain